MEGIKLVNIDLSGIDLDTQYKKVIEEMNELDEAVIDFLKLDGENIHKNLIDDVISEYFDLIQASLGYIYLATGISAEQIMEQYPKHLSKMQFRPRQKKCSDCIYALKNCKLYKSEDWRGEFEAESCRTFINEVR